MEDVLEVYTWPEEPGGRWCFIDECPKQLMRETRSPLPVSPGHSKRFDTEYVRNGTGELFMCTAPLPGWHRVEATEKRARVDWVSEVKKLVDKDFSDAEKIVLVMDNLNTQSIGSSHETFEAEEVRRIQDRLEIHLTPKHFVPDIPLFRSSRIVYPFQIIYDQHHVMYTYAPHQSPPKKIMIV
ncbi:MAG: transposase [Treponema sp.]|jgi:hypothetical protein|nr:transposase [Treponema sp.]